MKYEPLADTDTTFAGAAEESWDESKRNARQHHCSLRIVSLCSIVIIASLLSAGFGYYCGLKAQTAGYLPSWATSMAKVPIGYMPKVLEHDPIYTVPPRGNETEPAWEALLPKGQGFVRWPKDSPHISAPSYVHQIHCLYSIRRTMFRNEAEVAVGVSEEHMTPIHMGHCFDYLRQIIVCNADNTLEPHDLKLGGVTGWGFPRVCKRFDELIDWTEQWRTTDRVGFAEYPKGLDFPHQAGRG